MSASIALQSSHSIVICLGVLVAACAASTLYGGDLPPAVGDEVVTTGPASLQVGTEVLLTVPGGSTLAVKKLREGWIGVDVAHDGRTVAGWVSVRRVTRQPATLFLSLAVGYESEVDCADQDFQRMDKNGDSLLDEDEFSVGTRRETLEDLNRTLLATWGNGPVAPVELLIIQTRLMADLGNHRYWKRQMTADEFRQLADDFRTARDIRRSKLARSLVDSEPAATTLAKAQALFVWADHDRDAKLSLQEFRDALPPHGHSQDAEPDRQPVHDATIDAKKVASNGGQAATAIAGPASAASLTTAASTLLKPNVADANTVTLAVWFSSPITESNIAQLHRLASVLANQKVVIVDLIATDAGQREVLSHAVSAQPNVILLGTPTGRVARKRVVHADGSRLPPTVDAVVFIGFLNAEDATITADDQTLSTSAALNRSFVSACDVGKDAYVFAGTSPWDMSAGHAEEPRHAGAVANQSGRVAWYSKNAGGDDLARFVEAIRTRASGGGQVRADQ